jgi:hypothetical protein
VTCCFQIWEKRSYIRESVKVPKLQDYEDYFEITTKDKADFSFQRVGAAAGKIRTENFLECSESSHHFFKAKNNKVMEVFENMNFDHIKNNTAGNPSISLGEICQQFDKVRLHT